ncbi:MAG: hypothetical protein ACI308_02470 [Muribaculaceae bacterium]
MKKNIIAITLCLMAATVVSCGKSDGTDSGNDSTVVSVSPEASVDSEQTAIGVAVDGAMNSITLLVSYGDTLSFSYPDLDPAKRASWRIGDTITIKYVEVDGEALVNAVMLGSHP